MKKVENKMAEFCSYSVLKNRELVCWDDPEGWYGEGGRRGGSEWGTRVHLWQIHVDVLQNQYNIIK